MKETFIIERTKNESAMDFIIRAGKVLENFFKDKTVLTVIPSVQEGEVNSFSIIWRNPHA